MSDEAGGGSGESRSPEGGGRPDWRTVLRSIEFNPLDNLGLKLVALGLSTLLWVQVTSGQSVPQIVPNVPVELTDVPLQLAVSEPYTDTVEIRLRGMSERVRNLTSGQLIPTVDLSDAHAGENIVQLMPDMIPVPLGVEVERIEPDEIRIVLEERLQETVPVYPAIEGEPAEGYEVARRTVEPEEVTISGPRSHVRRIDRIETASVNIAGMEDTLTQRVALRLEDPLVEIVSYRSVSLTVEIREASVNRQFEDVPVRVEGIEFEVAVNPREIGVVLSAPPSVLGQVEEGTVEAVIDASDLEPREEDYRLEPTIRIDPPELRDRVRVRALVPQRLIDVHVYPARTSG